MSRPSINDQLMPCSRCRCSILNVTEAMSTNYKLITEAPRRQTEEFTRLYYKTYENQRQKIGNMYMDSANVSYNGKAILGREKIQRYLRNLPPCSHHLLSLSAQPILDPAGGPPKKVVVLTSGVVKFEKTPQQNFQQSFVLVSDNDTWRIVTDCYRIQDDF